MRPSSLRARPCVILAIELLGLDAPDMPEGRVQHAIDLVEPLLAGTKLGSEGARRQEIRCVFSGHRALRIVPIKAEGSVLFKELLNVVHVQSRLLNERIFMRGALMLGDAASRGEGIVGSGVVEAERLCAELNDVPRVIVDPRLLVGIESNADLRASHHTIAVELGFIQSLVEMDNDGLWFVDYLQAIKGEINDPSEYVAVLENHRRLIEARLSAAKSLDRAARTTLWLWRYHNQVVDKHPSLSQLHIPPRGRLPYVFPDGLPKPI